MERQPDDPTVARATDQPPSADGTPTDAADEPVGELVDPGGDNADPQMLGELVEAPVEPAEEGDPLRPKGPPVGVSAEEIAIRIAEDPPGATTQESDGYLEREGAE